MTIIPRTPFPEPTWRCGHPKTRENSYNGGQCRFCARVRALNDSAEKAELRRLERVRKFEERWG